MCDDQTQEVKVVAVPDNHSFVAGEVASEPKQVFVFGRQIDDFLSVDYKTGEGADRFEWNILYQGPVVGFAFRF